MEVERKFVCDAEVMGRLKDIGGVFKTFSSLMHNSACMGNALAYNTMVFNISISYLYPAKCIGQRQFQDQYFDSPDFILTLKDFWLRCREGLWELKCPAVLGSKPVNETETLCTRYKEITSFPLVQSEVRRIIKEHTAEGSESNSSEREQIDKVRENEDTDSCPADERKWPTDLNLVCFAEFKTERRSYTLEREDGAVRVDLDKADFGYCVGEIEVLVPEESDINEALRRIAKIAEELGELVCGDGKIKD